MLAHGWRGYWFVEGGRASAAAVRIAVAVSVLWTLHRLGGNADVISPAQAPWGVYHPVGILKLLGHAPPPAALIHLAQHVAWWATVALLAGLFTRTAAAVSLVASLVVACFAVSFTPSWSHDHNLPFLALFAVQGTQAGDVLGVDGWLRRWRGRPAPPSTGFAWTPRLVQVTTALMFLAAMAFKLAAGYFTLRWALSDNLRNQFLVQFDLNHLPRTPIASWLMVSSWRYRTVATLNLANQLAPILACFFIRRPLVRALLGGCFVAEVLGIGVVMNLWDLHWLPLFAAFVDWDRLLAWLRRRPEPPRVEPAQAARGRHRVALAYLTVFLLYDVTVSFAYPRIDQRLGTYPFSAFPMFATIRARPPYDVHQPYDIVGSRFELIGDVPIDPELEVAVNGGSVGRKLQHLEDPIELQRYLTASLAGLAAGYPEQKLRGLRLWVTSYRVPAYPAPPVLEPHDLAILGEVDVAGHWLSGLSPSSATGRSMVIQVQGELAAAPLVGYVDGAPEPVALTAVRGDGRLVIALPPGKLIHVVARVATAAGPRDLLLARWPRRNR